MDMPTFSKQDGEKEAMTELLHHSICYKFLIWMGSIVCPGVTKLDSDVGYLRYNAHTGRESHLSFSVQIRWSCDRNG